MKISFPLLLSLALVLQACSNAAERTSVPFQAVDPLKITRLDLSKIPNFRMPKGSFWMAMLLPELEKERDFVRKGNTYFPIRSVVGQVDTQQITVEQAKAFLQTLPPGTGLYEMLGDDDMCKQSGPLQGLWTNPVTVSPEQVRDFLTGWWWSRAYRFGWGNARVFFDLDLEGFPAAWKNNQVLSEGVKLVRQQHPNVEFAMYASGKANLYPEGKGGPDQPYEVVGGEARHQLYKKAGFTFFEMMPYAHYEEALIGPGKAYASFDDYAARSSLHMRQCLKWLDERAAFTGKNYKGFSWVMTRYEGGNLEMIAPHVCESLPLWFLVSGAGKSGGGICSWNPGEPLNAADFAFEAGKWRASQFNEFWESPKTQYNVKIEFSLDNGQSWTDDSRTWKEKAYDLGLRQFQWMYTNSNPIGVRGALLGNKLVVVAAARPSLEAGKTQSILCRHGSKVWKMDLPYHQVVAGTVVL